MRNFGWTRVTIITEEANLFIQNLTPLMNELQNASIIVSNQSFTFASDSDVAATLRDGIMNTNNVDSHIFFINTYEKAGGEILCEFYRQGYSYPSYGFITYNWYQERWWEKQTFSCTSQQLQNQLNRVVAIDQFPQASDMNAPTISGLSPYQFTQRYTSFFNGSYPQYSGLSYQVEAFTAFDAIWSLALALDRVQRAVCASDNLGCNISPTLNPLEDYRYFDAQMECMLNRTLNDTGFNGVTGYVDFDQNGTRIQNVFFVFQYVTSDYPSNPQTSRSLIAELDLSTNTLDNKNTTPIWPNGSPPDGTPIEEINGVHLSVTVIFYVFSLIGIAFGVACLIFNVVFRNKKVIKLASPNLNYIIAVGSIIAYLSIIVISLPTNSIIITDIRCTLGYWLCILGYTIPFSAVLTKLWRVYYIFHNPTTKKRAIKDWHLLIAVGVINFIILILLAIGEAIPSTNHISIDNAESTKIPDSERSTTRNDLNVEIQYFIYSCYPTLESIAYQAAVLSFMFLLQVIGIVLAFQTRKIKVRALNEAKQVTTIIYITSVSLVVIIMTVFGLRNYLNVSTALLNISITFAATSFLVLMFAPKMYSLYRDPDGENIYSKEATERTGGMGGAGGVAAMVQQSSSILRKMSLGIDSNQPTDDKAIIAGLQEQVDKLTKELRQAQSIPELDESTALENSTSFVSKSDISREDVPTTNGSLKGSHDKLNNAEKGINL
jgi:gamma-aminobutyric acid type B receptor